MSPAAEASDSNIILALNSGSSSLKFGLYRVGHCKTEMLVSGEAEAIGASDAKFHAISASGDSLLSVAAPIGSQEEAVARIAKFLADGKFPVAAAIGHRVVHGGPGLLRHCLIDDAVLKQLNDAMPFAPLHIPAALAVIRFARANFPNRPQVACFDTSFHADLPDVACTLPIPRVLRSEGIRRYGFHGLSCESIVHQLAGNLPERLIVAHLGNGASVTAIRNGKSIDTSMGLTPTGGVIMSTRTGDLDPGVLVYLIREKGYDAAQLEDLVDHRSGLLGISGLDGDMRRLHEAASSDDHASLAIEMFCYSVRKQIAAMIAALGGIDIVVFTGGIGENDEVARAMICEGLSWAGIGQAETRSWTRRDRIPDSKVYILPSGEDEQIARHTWSLQKTAESVSPPPL
jgi:acetate kinase